MKSTVVVTADGSSSVYVPELDEHYHSIHGAIQESVHVFIQAGLKYKADTQDQISILEIGFGTGLNTLLTCLYAKKYGLQIKYVSLEKYPLDSMIISSLNFPYELDDIEAPEIWKTIHELPWNGFFCVYPDFQLNKMAVDLKEFNTTDQFDIIYFDAFAPSAQPELWTISVFENIFNVLKNTGILVTYCAKGSVKRTLKQIGFTVESLPGPKGKREMIRALKVINVA